METKLESQSRIRKLEQFREDILTGVEEGELIIAFLANRGDELDPDTLEKFFKIKYKLSKGEPLSEKDEICFWEIFSFLCKQIRPQKLARLKNNSAYVKWNKRHPLAHYKVKRVPMYYGIAVFILIFVTVCFQTYYVIGVDVLYKTQVLFEARNTAAQNREQMRRLDKEQLETPLMKAELKKLNREYELADQELDSNRTILHRWNSIWQLGGTSEVEFSHYDQTVYVEALKTLSNAIQAEIDNNIKLRESHLAQFFKMTKTDRQEENVNLIALLRNHKLSKSLDFSRNRFFIARAEAIYVTQLLEDHILPLLFGCLGAFTLVMRSIHNEFQNSTFRMSICLDYNLRIFLGGVTGISSGLFFGDSGSVDKANFSPMLIAFIVGYNIEILFSAMDNMANKLSMSMEKKREALPNDGPEKEEGEAEKGLTANINEQKTNDRQGLPLKQRSSSGDNKRMQTSKSRDISESDRTTKKPKTLANKPYKNTRSRSRGRRHERISRK